MPQLTDIQKVNIILWCKDNKEEVETLNVYQLSERIEQEFGINVKSYLLYKWRRNHNINFLSQRRNNKKSLSDLQKECETNKVQTRILCNAVKELYYQLNIPIPNQIKKLTCNEGDL